jgi:hypothetical protein
MPKASGDSTTAQEYELRELEGQMAEQVRAWTARLVGEIDAPGSLEDTAQSASRIGEVLASLNHAYAAIRATRGLPE